MTTRPIRIAVTILMGLGMILLIVGVLGDIEKWWNELPFSSNILAGFTGALIGVPFVLLILGRMTAHQSEEMERRTARWLQQKAASDLCAIAGRIYVDGAPNEARLCELRRAIEALDGASSEIRQTTSRVHGGLLQIPPETQVSQEDLAILVQQSRKCSALLDQVVDLALATLIDWHEFPDVWSEILMQWEFLDHDVKPRSLAAGHQWIKPQTHRLRENVRSHDFVRSRDSAPDLLRTSNRVAEGLGSHFASLARLSTEATVGDVHRISSRDWTRTDPPTPRWLSELEWLRLIYKVAADINCQLG